MKSRRNPHLSRLALTALTLLILLPFMGCRNNSQNDPPCIYGEQNAFTSILLSDNRQYQLKSRPEGENIYSLLENGNSVVCLDVQANPLVSDLKGIRFVPQGLVSIVFVIDHSKTDLSPQSWEELLHSNLSVRYPTNSMENCVAYRAAIAAIAYGLEGENYTKDCAIRYLKELERKGQLQMQADCPVTICFDAEAVKMAEQGFRTEIVVPKDGTLTFEFGILGAETLNCASPARMLEAGFRTTDGACKNRLYPDAESYISAPQIHDFHRFETATKNATKDIRRTVFGTRYTNSADTVENVIYCTVFILLIIVWTTYALHRSVGKKTGGWIKMISGINLLWILLSMFKYMLLIDSRVSRICWYGYYVFLLGLPIASLYLSATVDRPGNAKKLPVWFMPFILIYPVLLILIFTNDFHQLVFRSDGKILSEKNYSYGGLYYLIFAFAILTLLLSILIFIVKSRKSPRKYAWIMPVCVAVLLVAFNVGVVCNVSFLREANLAMVMCIFSLLITQSMFYAGFIPTNRGYQALFSSSPLNMQIFNREMKTVFASSEEMNLTDLQKTHLCLYHDSPIRADDRTLIHSCSINGGFASWQEDISTIQIYHNKLKASIENMKKTNALLQNESEITRQKIRLEVKEKLFSNLEKDLKEETEELSGIIKKLPSAENRSGCYAYISLLLCHIKRRCNLFFLSQEGEKMSSTELAMYLDELSEFASYSKVNALVRCGIPGELKVESAILCYDFYFSIIRSTVVNHFSTLIGQITEQNGKIIFNMMSSAEIADSAFPESFWKALNEANASLCRKRIDENESITLFISAEGDKIS